jgi:predicted methyltransferase
MGATCWQGTLHRLHPDPCTHRVFRFANPAGKHDTGQKHLAIALMNGMLQLMSSQIDQHPLIVDTMVHTAFIAWNPTGTILVVAGTADAGQQDQEANVVRFFSSSGVFLHQMRIPRSKKLEGMLSATLLCPACKHSKRHTVP